MDVIVIVVIVVVVVVALVAAGLLVARRRSSKAQLTKDELRKRFGPEYERAVQRRGGERAAEAHLNEVAQQRERLDIRPLDPAARDGYARRWEIVQADFVDRPGAAVEEADRLILEVMSTRGYPVEDFEQRAELVAADHPQVVEHYRAAHVSRRLQNGAAAPDTEALRTTFTHYRALFDELVHDGAGEPGTERRS